MMNLIKHPIFKRGIRLGEESLHDLSHFHRVERFGLTIAEKNGADKKVISLFAYLHDARRENDDDDPDHGRRAVVLLDELIEAGLIELTKMQYRQLSLALAVHNRFDASSADLTVQTCWDADRLDLWRADIVPDPKYMFTEHGKSEKMIEFSRNLSLSGSA